MAELVKTEDGRAYYDDGSVRHAPGTEKAGTYIERPPQAAPLITKENASQLAKRKHELRQQAVEEGLALGVAEAAGLDDILTPDEMLVVLATELGKAAMDKSRKDYARLVSMILDLTQAMPQKQITVDQRTQKVEFKAEEMKIMASSPEARRLLGLDDGSGETE